MTDDPLRLPHPTTNLTPLPYVSNVIMSPTTITCMLWYISGIGTNYTIVISKNHYSSPVSRSPLLKHDMKRDLWLTSLQLASSVTCPDCSCSHLLNQQGVSGKWKCRRRSMCQYCAPKHLLPIFVLYIEVRVIDKAWCEYGPNGLVTWSAIGSTPSVTPGLKQHAC